MFFFPQEIWDPVWLGHSQCLLRVAEMFNWTLTLHNTNETSKFRATGGVPWRSTLGIYGFWIRYDSVHVQQAFFDSNVSIAMHVGFKSWLHLFHWRCARKSPGFRHRHDPDRKGDRDRGAELSVKPLASAGTLGVTQRNSQWFLLWTWSQNITKWWNTWWSMSSFFATKFHN